MKTYALIAFEDDAGIVNGAKDNDEAWESIVQDHLALVLGTMGVEVLEVEAVDTVYGRIAQRVAKDLSQTHWYDGPWWGGPPAKQDPPADPALHELRRRFPVGSRVRSVIALGGQTHRLEGTVVGYDRIGLVCIDTYGCFQPDILTLVESKEE